MTLRTPAPALGRGEWRISSFETACQHRRLPGKTEAQISLIVKRPHVPGPIHKVAHTWKYCLTRLGPWGVLAALKLREPLVMPSPTGALALERFRRGLRADEPGRDYSTLRMVGSTPSW